MVKQLLVLLTLVLMTFCFIGCEETEESVDNNNDIIIRNASEQDLWIVIGGVQRGRIDDDGIARTMWDNIPDGQYLLEAYRDANYTVFHCQVTTDLLEDGEDFYWYLLDDHEYEGTFDGDC